MLVQEGKVQEHAIYSIEMAECPTLVEIQLVSGSDRIKKTKQKWSKSCVGLISRSDITPRLFCKS